MSEAAEVSEPRAEDPEESKPLNCKYCTQLCDPYENPNLICISCNEPVHVRCLRRGGVPGGLIGDVFFDLTCVECHPLHEETLIRQKISWLGIVILTLYNLRAKSAGISNRGYFHWNLNVNAFVEKHWDILFPKNVKQKKNWKGTISGALSHSSKKGQIFFQSGFDELAESGYWKLINNDPPEVLIARNDQAIVDRKRRAKIQSSIQTLQQHQNHHQHQYQNYLQNQNLHQQPEFPTTSLNSSPVIEESSSCDDSYGDSSRTQTPSMFSREYVQPTEILSNFLFADDDLPDKIDPLATNDDDNLLNDIDVDLNQSEESSSIDIKDFDLKDLKVLQDFDLKDNDLGIDLNLANQLDDLDQHIDDHQDLGDQDDNPDDLDIDLKNFSDDADLLQFFKTFNPDWMHDMLSSNDNNDNYEDTDGNDDDSNDSNGSTGSTEPEPPQSLFSSAKKRDYPWKKKRDCVESSVTKEDKGKRVRMNKNEEEYLLSTINSSWVDKMTPRIRRLYRKLVVRRIKRLGNVKLVDWDEAGRGKMEEKVSRNGRERVIDRFRRDLGTARMEQRLMGYCENGEICSPYTQRGLKPFIRRDDSCRPLWLEVMQELEAKVNGKQPDWRPRPRATVDYSYVRPQHIPGINSLACQFFWPGIDLTECLQYPDFTCVVLYKKLIIGFGILVPDIGFDEAYISFFLIRPEWRNSGIGTFMLYHLIQTSMGKDVTLHVSATNPALILYQKFGFKIEQFVQDFYDKYMTTGAKESRHALFLRLSR
ncbi:cysteine-rich protein 2-binding protein [Microplitis mediator]|uniref:cysteine-rich protein 2-binding protein n=1 Tax=Microplitis mediator TaxID=375433 RepID=UPI00255709B9|nr:cysteine-rich protein 2-binding protein [Microplitis mediator]